MSLLENIHSPADLKALTRPELDQLAVEIRALGTVRPLESR